LKWPSAFTKKKTSPCFERTGGRLSTHGVHVDEPWRYRAYIAQSRAELGIFANAYVKSRCGWLSDRSAAYPASGKPVLAQDTGLL
jgi:hypothetical protein